MDFETLQSIWYEPISMNEFERRDTIDSIDESHSCYCIGGALLNYANDCFDDSSAYNKWFSQNYSDVVGEYTFVGVGNSMFPFPHQLAEGIIKIHHEITNYETELSLPFAEWLADYIATENDAENFEVSWDIVRALFDSSILENYMIDYEEAKHEPMSQM